MATIQRFEDLLAWQKARELAKAIYRLSKRGPFSRDFELRNQMNASSGSAMDNIAEGFERDGNKEFVQFLSIAKGSCGEVKSQLYRAKDREYIDQSTFQRLYDLAEEISQHIGGLIKHLKSSSYRGTKYKK